MNEHTAGCGERSSRCASEWTKPRSFQTRRLPVGIVQEKAVTLVTVLKRYVPVAAAMLVLLGSLLPFAVLSTGPSINLISLPNWFAQAGHVLALLTQNNGADSGAAQRLQDLNAAQTLAYFVYGVPGLAALVLLRGLGGPLCWLYQIGVAILWIVLALLAPFGAIMILAVGAGGMGKLMAVFGGDPAADAHLHAGIGFDLILTSAAGLLVLALVGLMWGLIIAGRRPA